MNKKAVNRNIKFVIKLSLTAAALFFVFRKINVDEFIQALSQVRIPLYIAGFVAFNISKSIAAFRLNHFYGALDVQLSWVYNLRLYYLGMFYNIFLPGSISGDGYKVYVLRQNHDVKTSDLIGATLLDRISGLSVLIFFAAIFGLLCTYAPQSGLFKLVLAGIMVVCFPAYYFFTRMLFRKFLKVFIQTTHLSAWVQAGQVLCALCLLLALRVNMNYMDYLALFMISSVVAVLPISIGGMGAREIVFLYGYNFLQIDEATAIAFTMLFFSVTFLTALTGLAVGYTVDNTAKTPD